MVVIKVEKTLFKIHKHMLLQSETFSDMFKLPGGVASNSGEGSTPENPIQLSGIRASDFEALMRVLYAKKVSVLTLGFRLTHREIQL
ncbi:hypothetical protein RSOLAG1IB_06521 [Rhizoctonia solani AG-1 IB]|uniref:BTB domain-containing protein n=1 Tax=Thanatephorus cucumeris (strain AG1-IB / isolate 7/3/14) TaxID=1108050 RepID=A0A0B7F6H4_THACB|nr:hypothetical protein RSOLAG1IB_06521 [Rhizoctonia solani AG-1 IB]